MLKGGDYLSMGNFMKEAKSGVSYLPVTEYPSGWSGFSREERTSLERFNESIAGFESLEAMVDSLFQAIRTFCPCDRIGIAFVEPDGRVVSRYVTSSYEPVLLTSGYAEDLQGSSLEAVIQEGTPRIIRDLEEYLAQNPESRSTKIIVQEGVLSSITIPLSVEDRNTGLLFLSSRKTDAFEQHHVRILSKVVGRLGQAVEKAYRIMQLEAMNTAYTEMLGFVSHELKSPVASLVTDAHLMKDGYLGELDERQKDKLERMIKKGEYLLGLVREYLDLARMEGGELNPEFKDVDDFVGMLLDPAFDLISVQVDDKGMVVERVLPNSPCKLICDIDLIKIVLVNLLGNAVKYGNEGGLIRITLECAKDDVNCSVWNEGPGFPESERSNLFRKFSRLKTPELRKRKGTGVGLYTSWRIIQLHGGRISADSQEGSWAEFRFTIPRNPAGRSRVQ